jgi:hypothetical protein
MLDGFVDGILSPREHARVLAHVDGCERCSLLLEELRVVDALLFTPRQLDPAPNFTFKTMAEVRALAPPHRHHAPALGVFAAYLAFAWTIIGLWFVFGGVREAAAMFAAVVARNGAALASLAGATSQIFGRATSGVTALMGAVLLLDLAALAAVALFYAVVRPRLAAHLARSSEAA